MSLSDKWRRNNIAFLSSRVFDYEIVKLMLNSYYGYKFHLKINSQREQGVGYRRIAAKYPDKNWNLNNVTNICKRVDNTGSSVVRKHGSGRPKTARTVENIEKVHELICSQENQPGTTRSTQKIAAEQNIHHSSVQRIAKHHLVLTAFRRVPAQVILDKIK